MHPRIYSEFDRVCEERRAGGAVLEIGAVPAGDTLLTLPALARSASRIGVSLDGPSRFGGFEILRANANRLDLFDDARFDTVLCNSVLEHDPFFWTTLAEIRRVARPGAVVVLGVPGFDAPPPSYRRLSRLLAGLPSLGRTGREEAEGLAASTPTLVVHRFPSDHYRFSREAVEHVLLEGLDDREVATVLTPPRFVGSGIRC